MSAAPLRVGVLASMKRGLEHFIYRELRFLESSGARISVFPTKYGPGPYDVEPGWDLHRWNPLSVLAVQPLCVLKSPVRYLRILREALVLRGLVEFLLASYFSRWMAEEDVIYATFGDRKLFVGYFCKRILGTPLVVEIHAYELYQNPNSALFARALSACDHVITVSVHNHDLLTAQHGVNPARIDVVRYGVDLDDYRSEDKFVVLIVAYFVERKGHEVLFEAVKMLHDDSIEVWVVGDEGAEENSVDVRRLAVDLDVASQVAFFGRLSGNALRAVYRACDAFCLPCRIDSQGVAEGFPNVLIEAMAFGKPVITTRHVEIPRVIDAVLVDENDVSGLADAISDVKSSAPLRRRLGERNRAKAEQVFSPRNVERTWDVLREVAEAGRHPL